MHKHTGLLLPALIAVLGLAPSAATSARQAPSPVIQPADKASGVPVNIELSWPATEAAQFDVYFGLTNPPAFQSRIDRPSFVLETLCANTTYYWRVDAVGASGISAGVVRRFTTAAGADRAAIYAWPIRIATSVRALHPSAIDLGNWNYTEGMIADALFMIATKTGRDDDITYVR